MLLRAKQLLNTLRQGAKTTPQTPQQQHATDEDHATLHELSGSGIVA